MAKKHKSGKWIGKIARKISTKTPAEKKTLLFSFLTEVHEAYVKEQNQDFPPYRVGDIIKLRVVNVSPEDVVTVQIEDGQRFDIISPPRPLKRRGYKEPKYLGKKWVVA